MEKQENSIKMKVMIEKEKEMGDRFKYELTVGNETKNPWAK